MPLYFFNVGDGQSPRDDQALRLKNDADAYREALLYAVNLLEDRESKLWDTQAWAVSIVAEDGRQLVRIGIDVASGGRADDQRPA